MGAAFLFVSGAKGDYAGHVVMNILTFRMF